MIDLEAHWWGTLLAPALALALAAAVAIAGRLLVVWLATPRGRTWEIGAGRLPESEKVARTFQRSFFVLATLMVLCFASRVDLLSCVLFAAYFATAASLFMTSLRDGAARRLSWFQNTHLIAFLLGLALSILLGPSAYVGMDYAVNEYIQAH